MQKSRLVLVPAGKPRAEGDVSTPSPSSLKETTLPDGSTQLLVPWPLDVEELKALLGERLEKYRIIHLANATKVQLVGLHASKSGPTFLLHSSTPSPTLTDPWKGLP